MRRLFKESLHVLESLRESGYRLTAATGKHRVGPDYSLETHMKLEFRLEMTRCADESGDKPDPLMLRQILRGAGVREECALMIGDTKYDVVMASAVRMQEVGVCSGVHGAIRPSSADVSGIIDGIGAWPPWLAAL